jgi:hypothetical protein
MRIPRPDWNPADREKSLDEQASWLNSLARAAFEMDGKHPEMFFLVGEDGRIEGLQFRDGLPTEEKNSEIRSLAQRFAVFGTIHIRLETVYHPKLTGRPEAQGIQFLDGTSDYETNEKVCLLVEMESRNGTHRIWANPVLDDEGQLSLGDTLTAAMA